MQGRRGEHATVINQNRTMASVVARKKRSAGRQSSEFEFIVTPTGKRVGDDYFVDSDEFTIELVKKQSREETT